MGRHIHQLSDKDIETLTATCAHCGPIRLVSSGKSGFRCINAKRASDRTPGRAAYMKEYGRRRYVETGGRTQRESWLRRYGLTPETYAALLAEQGGGCAICHAPCPSGQNLSVDHDHTCCPGDRSCGKCIRGLLCRQHNRGLGMFNDDPALLTAAAEYLRR